MKSAGMNIAHVIRLLSMANNDLQSVEYRCQVLRREVASLEASNRNAARTLEQLTYVISDTQNTLDHYESLRKQQRAELDKLFHQKIQLEEFLECFKSNSTEYAAIKENVKQEVENTLMNPKKLMRLALLALIESLRKDTDKFQSLYYEMSTDIIATTLSQSLTPSYDSQNYSVSNLDKQYLSQDYNTPTHAF
jgi:chromosome segregation ATPase